MSTVCYFLSLLDAPQLETFHLVFFFETRFIGELDDVDRLLAKPKFAGLKEVVVNTRFPCPAPSGIIEAHFPLARERGILKIINTGPFDLQLPILGAY